MLLYGPGDDIIIGRIWFQANTIPPIPLATVVIPSKVAKKLTLRLLELFSWIAPIAINPIDVINKTIALLRVGGTSLKRGLGIVGAAAVPGILLLLKEADYSIENFY